MDLSVKAHELATKLTSIQRLLNQFGPWHQGTQADSKEYWLIQRQNILLSSLLTSCFFSGGINPFLLVKVWVLPFTAYDFSPRGHYDFSVQVFTEDVVGMQILRGQDSI